MIERIFLLHARAQSGKDTCATIMKDIYEAKGKRVIIVAFADYVKFVLHKYYKIDDYKSPEGRTTIQHFATDLVRTNDPTFWARTVGDLLFALYEEFDYVIIPDWRFKNELTTLCARFAPQKVVKVLITRPNNENTDNMTQEQREHLSECELDNWKNFDYNIINEYGNLQHTQEQLKEMIIKEQYLYED